MSRHFRIGWGTNSLLANSSGTSAFGEVISGGEPFSVVIEQQMMTGSGSHAQILSLESWLAVSLDNSEAVGEDVEGDASPIPKFEPVRGLKCLHAHVGEAATQMEEVMDDEEGASDNNREVGETKQVWDLMMALWGKLEGKHIQKKIKCVRCFLTYISRKSQFLRFPCIYCAIFTSHLTYSKSVRQIPPVSLFVINFLCIKFRKRFHQVWHKLHKNGIKRIMRLLQQEDLNLNKINYVHDKRYDT